MNYVGYNSIEIDGEGDEIHPFGAVGSKLYTNCGHGVFIRPLVSSKTLDHSIDYGASVNNHNAYSIGFAPETSAWNDARASGASSCATSVSESVTSS